MSFGNDEATLQSAAGQSPQERITYQGELEPFLHTVLSQYEKGDYVSHEVKQNGYEDFNLILHTTEQDIFLKSFAQWRNQEECLRYLDMIQTAIEKGGVQTPEVYLNLQNKQLTDINIDNATVYTCAMKYLDGGNIWESGSRLTITEQEKIIQTAAKINLCDYHPPFVHDSWAIVNAQETYAKNRERVEQGDIVLIDQLMIDLEKVDMKALPHAFVHGDIRSTNVMRHSDGDIYVIDFSVANWYPRVVELAVILSDLLFDPENLDSFNDKYEWAIIKYQEAGVSLTDQEIQALPVFIRLAHAMNIIGSSSVDATQYISQLENNYWLKLGKAGLNFTMTRWQPKTR